MQRAKPKSVVEKIPQPISTTTVGDLMMAEATKEKQQGKKDTSLSFKEVQPNSNTATLRRLLREENLAPTIVGPSIESQVRQLFEHDTAIAKFRTEAQR